MGAENINAYILAGGSSRRIRKDKLFLQIGDQTLLSKTVATCENCFEKVKLVAVKPARLSSLGIDVVQDSPAAKGPMAGIIAALEDSDTDTCFITAADLPDLSVEIIAALIAKYHGQRYFGLMEPNGLQPLCGIYHKSSIDDFYQFAKRGNFSVADVVKSLDHDLIKLPPIRWRNINYPEDLVVGNHDD
jgi:molybdopterin-guanine dinucleotide biosynthesis protein A